MAQHTPRTPGRARTNVSPIHAPTPRKKTVRRSRKKDPAIQETLDALCAAMTSGDGQGCAELFVSPAFFLGDEMLKAITDPAELAAWFGGAKQMYADKGITDTRAEIESLEWLTDKIVLVGCRFPRLDEAGEEHGEERASYTMRREDDGRFKLCVAVMRGVTGADEVDADEVEVAEESN